MQTKTVYRCHCHHHRRASNEVFRVCKHSHCSTKHTQISNQHPPNIMHKYFQLRSSRALFKYWIFHLYSWLLCYWKTFHTDNFAIYIEMSISWLIFVDKCPILDDCLGCKDNKIELITNKTMTTTIARYTERERELSL